MHGSSSRLAGKVCPAQLRNTSRRRLPADLRQAGTVRFRSCQAARTPPRIDVAACVRMQLLEDMSGRHLRCPVGRDRGLPSASLIMPNTCAGCVASRCQRRSRACGGEACKTVGSAYVGSNPTPATSQSPRSPGIFYFSGGVPKGAVRHIVGLAWSRPTGHLVKCPLTSRYVTCAVAVSCLRARVSGEFSDQGRNGSVCASCAEGGLSGPRWNGSWVVYAIDALPTSRSS